MDDLRPICCFTPHAVIIERTISAPIAGVGGLEGSVIAEGRRFYFDLLVGPVNVVGQRRQLQGIVGMPLRAQQPL